MARRPELKSLTAGKRVTSVGGPANIAEVYVFKRPIPI
jgi:hypothetical protein